MKLLEKCQIAQILDVDTNFAIDYQDSNTAKKKIKYVNILKKTYENLIVLFQETVLLRNHCVMISRKKPPIRKVSYIVILEYQLQEVIVLQKSMTY